MKTFKVFILEATEKTIQQLRAEANAARLKGDMKTFAAIQKEAGWRADGTKAKIAALISDDEAPKSNPNTWVSGKPQKPKDTRGRSGSLRDIPSSAGENPGTIVSGRFEPTTTGRSGGVRSTLANRGRSRTGTTLGRKA